MRKVDADTDDSPIEAADQAESERRMKMGAVNANVVIGNPVDRAKKFSTELI